MMRVFWPFARPAADQDSNAVFLHHNPAGADGSYPTHAGFVHLTSDCSGSGAGAMKEQCESMALLRDYFVISSQYAFP
jgi:hypothetical protein